MTRHTPCKPNSRHSECQVIIGCVIVSFQVLSFLMAGAAVALYDRDECSNA